MTVEKIIELIKELKEKENAEVKFYEQEPKVPALTFLDLHLAKWDVLDTLLEKIKEL